MAFNLQHFQFNRGVTSANAQGQGFTPVIHTYTSATDTRATIAGANYFPPFVDGDPEEIFTVDLLLVVGSDGVSLSKFTSLDPVVLGADLLVSGPTLTVAAPTTATDANALIISGNTIRSQIGTFAFPGIVSTIGQSFAGVKNFEDGASAFGQGLLTNHLNAQGAFPLPIGDNGITTLVNVVSPLLADQGIMIGTADVEHTLSDFRSNANSFAWTGPFTVNPTGLIFVTRIVDIVYATIVGIPVRAQNAAAVISAVAAVPVGYRPSSAIATIGLVTDNVTNAVGLVSVSTAGAITIGSNVSGAAFGGAGVIATGDLNLSWQTTDP